MVLDPLLHHSIPHEAGYREVLPGPALVDALAKVRLVDVRDPHEAAGALGRIAGAEIVPLASLRQAAQRWDRGAPLVIVCRSGKRAGTGSATLSALGFERVYNLRGGMLRWIELGLPTLTHALGSGNPEAA
jgi:rhodanese-related sulfurtransferase